MPASYKFACIFALLGLCCGREVPNDGGSDLARRLISGDKYYAIDCTITGSSTYSGNEPYCGRILDPDQARPSGCDIEMYWNPRSQNHVGSWWQVELSGIELFEINSIATEGQGTNYVSQYRVSYAVTEYLIPYLDNGDIKIFSASSPAAEVHQLTPPIRGRTFRLHLLDCEPTFTYTNCRLRVELYGNRVPQL